MIKSSTYQVLNRLLTVLERSLPVYLLNTSPWVPEGEEEALKTLRNVAEDQRQMATRVGHYIIDRYGPPDTGAFPIDFFDTHDLSLDFLIRKLVACQKSDVAKIEAIVPALADDRQAAILAEEALGAARGHLETFEELAGQVAKR